MRSQQLIVALESSVRPASLAARRGGETRAVVLEDDRAHASDLVQQLERALAELGARPADIDLVVVGLGPGSYTGLRVSAATALGIAYGSGATIVGVPSFEALALDALAPGEVADVLVDARGGHLYHARYRRTEDSVTEERAPSAVPYATALAALEAPVWLAEDDALAAAGIALEARHPQRAGHRPDARALLTLAPSRLASRGPTAVDALRPLYLRDFTPQQRSR